MYCTRCEPIGIKYSERNIAKSSNLAFPPFTPLPSCRGVAGALIAPASGANNTKWSRPACLSVNSLSRGALGGGREQSAEYNLLRARHKNHRSPAESNTWRTTTFTVDEGRAGKSNQRQFFGIKIPVENSKTLFAISDHARKKRSFRRLLYHSANRWSTHFEWKIALSCSNERDAPRKNLDV